MRFRKRPVIVEAERWTGDNGDTVGTFLENGNASWEDDSEGGIVIHTLEGSMTADPGDWIIRGVKGEFYPCKPDIFNATYEPVGPGEKPIIGFVEFWKTGTTKTTDR